MALVRCEDCGRKVSDAALACPQCARPVAILAESRAVGVTVLRPATPRPRKEPPARPAPDALLPPTTLQWQQELRRLRESPDAAAKRCKQCGADVACDSFRLKLDRGYLCRECQDEEDGRNERIRARLRKLVGIVVTIVLAVSITATVTYVSRIMPTAKTDTTKPQK